MARVPLAWVAFVAAASALGAIAGAGACLPDLAVIAVERSEGAAPPFVGCGDGVIATLDDGGDAGESCDPGTIDAQVPGCKSCQLACKGTIDPSSGHCYFALVGLDSDYSVATTRCQGESAHLVTLASRAEADLVRTVADATGESTGYWIGLSRTPPLGFAYAPSHPEEPGFPYPPAGGGASGPCDGCFGLGAGDAGVFPTENAGEPDALCISSRGGIWFQVACNKGAGRTTICEREPVGTRAQNCSGGFCFTLRSTASKKTYLVVVSAAEPDQAARDCADLDGGSLVVLGSAEEREQLAHEILALDPTAVEQQLWIGLGRDGGAWVWEDGVPATARSGRPLPWGNAQPTDAGGARAFLRLRGSSYDTQLAYADDGGRAPRLSVCQRPPP